MSVANWAAGLLREAPLDLPLSLGYAARGLAPLLEGPSVLEQERRFREQQDADAAAAGAMTPQQRMAYSLRNAEIGPLAENIAGAGNVYGVSPRRLSGWHGTGDALRREQILQGGFRRGASAELNVPGTSVSNDPMLSFRAFAENEPDRLLRTRAEIDPSTVRNLSPGEYSASGHLVHPRDFPAVSKPQSYFPETEIFYTGQGGGQQRLRARGMTPQERAAVERTEAARLELNAEINSYRNRTLDLGERPGSNFITPERVNILLANAPTPAEGLRLLQQIAQGATRYERPNVAGTIAVTAERPRYGPYSESWRQLFPEDMGRLQNIEDTARAVQARYNAQRGLGGDIAETVQGNAPYNMDVRTAAGRQTTMYRDFTRLNEPFIRNVSDMPVRPTERLAQQLVMRDLLQQQVRSGVPFWEVVEGLVPEMRALGFTQNQIRSIIREPGTFDLGRAHPAAARRALQQRREVLEME